jgi:Fic family protein
MKRGQTGRYESTSVGGESVRAFIPDPLPPAPALFLEGELTILLERAVLALGRLDSLSTLLPGTGFFLYGYIRKEAVLSSQIEGTQSSLSDLLLFELDQVPGVPINDVQEVSNYVRAVEHGIAEVRKEFPLSSRLIRDIHNRLLAKGRGGAKEPGEFRRSQNCIGGSRPGNAVFVPPPHTELGQCMSALEKFIHAQNVQLPIIIRAGLLHVQFETIHPFLDGNGRVGRLLITLYLCATEVLHEPLLYLSLFFKENRAEYYRLLDLVRTEGDWEQWLAFFLRGVAKTAEGAVNTARRLVALYEKDRKRLAKIGRQAGSVLRILDALRQRPVNTIDKCASQAGLSFPSTAAGLQMLVKLGIVRELTGRKRNRIYAYDQYVSILSEGTTPQ